jgi:8-oxo-dGTP pyrophosphatase MutT (NUDIX family)
MTHPNFIAAYLCDKINFDKPHYLLLKRSQDVYLPGIWQIVTGKLDLEETASEACKREIFEETGFRPSTLYNVDVTMFYDQTKDKISYSANFCGLIDSKTPIVISKKEHDDFGYFSFEKAQELLAFPSQKETLSFIHKHFILQTPHSANDLR